MAVVTYAPGIETVSGSLAKPKKVAGHNHGDYLIGTHRVAPTENPNCSRLFVRKANTYERVTRPGAKELGARTRFGVVSQNVLTRSQDLTKVTADQQAFLAQKNTPGGKKTLNAWYWMVEGQAYDDALENG